MNNGRDFKDNFILLNEIKEEHKKSTNITLRFIYIYSKLLWFRLKKNEIKNFSRYSISNQTICVKNNYFNHHLLNSS